MRRANWIAVAVLGLLGIPWVPLFGQQSSGAAPQGNGKQFVVTQKMLIDRIKMFLLKNYDENHDDIQIDVDSVPEAIPVNPVDWEIQVESRYGAVKNGANSLTVTVFSRQSIYKKFVATARLRTFDDVVVAARLLNRGEKIGPKDVELKRVETTNFKRDYFTHLDEVVNLQAKQVIPAGKPIFTGMVELPDIIHRGDIVRIVVKLKNLKVTATGKALQNGHKGERIRVENMSTGKKLSAVVLDEKTVLVEL